MQPESANRLDAIKHVVRAKEIGTDLAPADRSVLAAACAQLALALDPTTARWVIDQRPLQ
jgi:hypothetical protein